MSFDYYQQCEFEWMRIMNLSIAPILCETGKGTDLEFICFGSRTFSSWIGRASVRKEISFENCNDNLENILVKLHRLIRETGLPGIEKRKTVAIDKKPEYDLMARKNGFAMSFDIEKPRSKAVLAVEANDRRMDAHVQLNNDDARTLFGNAEESQPHFEIALFGENGLLHGALQNHMNNRKEEAPFVVMEGLFRTLYLIAMEADKIIVEHIVDEMREAGRFKGVDPEDVEVFERFLSMFTASIRMAIRNPRQEEQEETKFTLPPSDAKQKKTMRLSEVLFRR